jgi:SAM-dependent methyltransferase
MNLDSLTKNMVLHEKGFWATDKKSDSISYPDEGNELLAEIEEESFWFSHRNDVITTGVKNFPPSGVIFDIGGGNGFVAKGLIDAGFDCALVEPGISGASKAVERGVENIFCATIESIGIEKKSIPGIGLFDVIEHIEDDISFLKNLHSLMVSGGRLYATVPAYNLLWSKEDEFAGHFRRYTKDSISKVLEKAGFEIEYATYFFRFLPPAIFAFRSIPSYLGKKSSASVNSHKKEHQVKKGIVNQLLNKLLINELKLIKMKKQLLVGGSCFIVAKS